MTKRIFLIILFFTIIVQIYAQEKITLWENGAPNALGSEDFDVPTLIYYPVQNKQAHTAILICPGGGYSHLAMEHEGSQVAEYFNKIGISAFVLKYRVCNKKQNCYHYPVPLNDANRAIRYIKANAEKYNIDSTKIGIMGFSAGGHLASSVSTHILDGNPEATDKLERYSTRPDFMILVYPVISFTTPYTHNDSRKKFLGTKNTIEMRELFSNELQVTYKTPPTLLIHANDDKVVPPENSILFYTALRKAGVEASLIIFPYGGHGFGMRQKNEYVDTWPEHCHKWLKIKGLIKD